MPDLYFIVAVALAELVQRVQHPVQDRLAPEEVREAADQLGEEGVGVLPDGLVGVVELDEKDDGDGLEIAVPLLVLRLAGHRIAELGEELRHDGHDALVDAVLVHLGSNSIG